MVVSLIFAYSRRDVAPSISIFLLSDPSAQRVHEEQLLVKTKFVEYLSLLLVCLPESNDSEKVIFMFNFLLEVWSHTSVWLYCLTFLCHGGHCDSITVKEQNLKHLFFYLKNLRIAVMRLTVGTIMLNVVNNKIERSTSACWRLGEYHWFTVQLIQKHCLRSSSLHAFSFFLNPCKILTLTVS